MRVIQLSDISALEITPREVYLNRRPFKAGMAALAVAPAHAARHKLPAAMPSRFSTNEAKTPFQAITTHNNFQSDPAEKAHTLKTRPWTVSVEGKIRRPKVYGLDGLLELAPLEERIYQLRCVEGWSMVIPRVGFPLALLIRPVEPTGNAKFVEFVSLYDPRQLSFQHSSVLDWPHAEGLRIDEANLPLSILAVGLYGEVLPNQNSAPIRLAVPWKYGFKGAKSLVEIRLKRKNAPHHRDACRPRRVRVFSNVNPKVDYPRSSQARERRIGELFKRDTLMFNGYADEVAHPYRGRDLCKYF